MKPNRSHYKFTFSLLSALVVFLILLQHCHAEKIYIPEILEPWKEWVLHDKEKQLDCIPMYNNAKEFQCAWPAELVMELDNRGGQFSQTWQVYSQTRVTLPGNARYWPEEILVNDQPVVTLEKNDRPVVLLEPGSHRVTGKFFWINIPEHLQVPAESGLVSLSVNNEKVPFPNIDVQGRMWLKQRQKEKRIEDRLKIDCFRLIEDAIPPRVEVSLFLDVAGKARQITLGPVYSPDRFIPLRVDSSLPAKLEQDGRLKVQVRPGRYRLSLALRHIAPLHDIEFTKPDHNEWPDREVWSFKARTDLRQVEISGASLIDPKQTAMPGGWQGYPAYLMQPGKKLMFKEIKRGDPNPAPDQLSLDRTLWLRFDGSGYFIQDRIKGKKNTNWRLEIDPSIHPGQVMVDGKEQLITREKDSPKPGIELRNGRVNILANSTFQNGNTNLPATGWDHDFTRVKGRLHLPPGWTLVNASGMDQIPRTWIKKWTLLDFFMVLIFTIALAKLYSKPLAAFAFVTLVLIFHEPNAPKYIWLALLLGFTLLKYLPDGRFKHLVRLYQGLAVLAFVVIVIPYSIQALRIGIYPQLAQPWTSMTEYASRSQARQPAPMEADSMQQVVRPMVKETVRMEPAKRIREKGKDMLMSTAGSAANTYQEAKVMQYDPKALTQTGPGMPLWPPFETVNFSWSGPVTRDQAVSFYLIGPKTNLILAFVRVGLIMLLAMGMFGISYSRGTGMKAQGLKKLVPALALILVCLAPVPSSASEIPPAHLLEELENRLLKKDDCFNACADLSSAKITLSRDRLSIKAQVDAGIDTAIPIPGDDKQWLASKIHINGSPAQGVFRKNGRLWLVIPKGIHTISMAGQVRSQGSFQLVFHLRPRHLDIKVEGWTAEGLHADGSFDSLIQFRRIIKSENKEKEILETGVLPSFARIERTLLLGMVWKVQTRVTREGDLGSGMVLDIPLLPKESITTPGIRVEGEKAKINFRAGQRSLFWESFLTPSDQIKLTHINTKDWAEIWKVDVSPIYHMEYSGIPVIFHKTGNRWYPTWYPWPGESVALSITRPAGIDGQTLTIEKSLLKLEPGRTSTNAILNLSIKSSQGGRHTITLPGGAQLQEVKIQGRIRPIRQDQNKVVLPIVPGKQEISLRWIDKQGISTRYKTPEVDLGIESANTSVDIALPRNRWPLFIGGEQLSGPAVLFWSVVIVILIIAFGLSKTRWTPLNFFHWFLLCIGMSMSHLGAGIVVVAWLVALDFRQRAGNLKGAIFNLVQVGILVLTLAAAACLVFAISNGLLGHPDMNIRGNGSSASLLRWYHDVSGPVLPQAWVISIPMLAYRIAMLAWALWVSFWLINILKWGWNQFTTPKIWENISFNFSRKKSSPKMELDLDEDEADAEEETGKEDK